MKNIFLVITILFFSFFAYKNSNCLKIADQPIKPTGQYLVSTQIQNFYDQKQHRLIPIEIYWPNNYKTANELSPKLIAKDIKAKTIEGFCYAHPEKQKIIFNQKLKSLGIVLINPGNKVAMTDYSYLAVELASHGFFVVAIENQLKNDPKLTIRKPLIETRMPAWQRGVDNNLAVIEELKDQDYSTSLDFNNITLIGHSLGGDTVMLFAKEYPDLAKNIVSLDNLRIDFPNQDKPKMLILRNQKRQDNPSTKEDMARAKKFAHQLIFIEGAAHRMFSDEGNNPVKSQINKAVVNFLVNSHE
jgi:dienelactone hydrolase